jgi:hypothetical protein
MSEQLAKEPKPAEGDTQAGSAFPQDVPRIFERIEHFTAIGIGALLAVGAVMALAGAVMVSWNAVVHWPRGLVEGARSERRGLANVYAVASATARAPTFFSVSALRRSADLSSSDIAGSRT